MPGATILGCEGFALLPDERQFFREADPWGFILFARNIETPEQVRRLTDDLRDALGREAPVLVDQEGGRVQRLRAPHWAEWLPPLEQMARTGTEAVRSMWLRYRLIAAELRDVGIDANCAPLADIAGPATHPFLRNRCYGEDVATVTAASRAVADGLLEGGVLPVLKHIPGHGRATVDSHLSLPTVTAPLEELEETDFAVFRALNDLPMAMTAHIVFPALDGERPATCSPIVMQTIRQDMGFGNLIMSDDISMQALAGSLEERSRLAIAAGCDVILHCNGKRAEMVEVVTASGRMEGIAAERGERALAARHAPDAADLPALRAELDRLLAEPVSG